MDGAQKGSRASGRPVSRDVQGDGKKCGGGLLPVPSLQAPPPPPPRPAAAPRCCRPLLLPPTCCMDLSTLTFSLRMSSASRLACTSHGVRTWCRKNDARVACACAALLPQCARAPAARRPTSRPCRRPARPTHRLLHGKQRHDLQEVVLDDVAHDAVLVKVPAAPLGAKVLGKDDLQVAGGRAGGREGGWGGGGGGGGGRGPGGHAAGAARVRLQVSARAAAAARRCCAVPHARTRPGARASLLSSPSPSLTHAGPPAAAPARCGCTACSTAAQTPGWQSAAP